MSENFHKYLNLYKTDVNDSSWNSNVESTNVLPFLLLKLLLNVAEILIYHALLKKKLNKIPSLQMRLSLDEKNLNHYWLNRPWMTKMKFCYYNIPKFTLTDTLVSLRWLEKSSKELMSRASNFEIAQKIELFSLSLISARNIHHVAKLWDGSKFEEKLEEPS